VIPNEPCVEQLFIVCNCGEFELSMRYPGGAAVGRVEPTEGCSDPGDHQHWFDRETDCGPHGAA